MSFELRDRDLLGRIGRLTTKGKTIETPAFMPVVNPLIQTIPIKKLKQEFGCDILITNSYIIRNHFKDIPGLEIHKLLDYNRVIMTDSGAYQILVYGEVGVNQSEIIDWQIQIGSDIGVILDIPTGWDVPRETVEYTVDETLRRAEAAIPLIKDTSNLWVGPIQGGIHLDLVAKSAKKIGEMPFDVHALGSPTEVMERYKYSVLVDMAMTAKLNAPIERPIHMFGAGHPNVFAMSVAMGYDLFDSAAYALFAKDERYITTRGTIIFKNLQYLPCSCPICRNKKPEDLRDLPKGERQRLIAEHNLHVTMAEVETIKQAIVEGSLWDLVETRAKGHPQMTAAIKTLEKYKKHLEESSPGFKGKGVFFYDYHSLAKPETTRYQKQLLNNYGKPNNKDVLILLTAPTKKPYNLNHGFKKLKKRTSHYNERIHYCFIAAPYGVIPEYLAETYPLSQYQIAEPLDHETIEHTINNIKEYIEKHPPEHMIIIHSDKPLEKRLIEELGEQNNIILTEELGDEETTESLMKTLKDITEEPQMDL
jgi:7-cyano-7-deazaguanine tRNA-ribosyltransferase